MRKFAYKDVHNWKVVSNQGKVMPYLTKDKDGKKVVITALTDTVPPMLLRRNWAAML